MRTTLNKRENELLAQVNYAIDRGYTGGGIGCSMFIGYEGLKDAANEVFALVRRQGTDNTHKQILAIETALQPVNIATARDLEICEALQKGVGMGRAAITVVDLTGKQPRII